MNISPKTLEISCRNKNPVHNFSEKERQKKTINTVFSAENDYPQNKKINFVIFYNDLCMPLNSNIQNKDNIKSVKYFLTFHKRDDMIPTKEKGVAATKREPDRFFYEMVHKCVRTVD